MEALGKELMANRKGKIPKAMDFNRSRTICLFNNEEKQSERNLEMLEIPPTYTVRENHCYQVISGLPIS